MKIYPLARNTAAHVYVTETTYLTPDDDMFETVGASCSAESEYELTGDYPDEKYADAAKELLEFIKPYSCRHALTSLFSQLGVEILKDLERIKDMPPIDEQSKARKEVFKEQYELLQKFLAEFKQI
jgi:hypothetical protein